MTKELVTIVLRSDKAEDNGMGEYEYQYTCVGPLLFTQSDKRFTFNDAQTINQTTKITQSLKGVFPNDKTNRIGRITHIVLHNKLYEVEAIIPNSPEITITPGEVSKMKLEEVGYNG